MKKVRPLLLAILVLCVSSCKVGRFVIYNFANITDYKKFPSRAALHATLAFSFHQKANSRHPRSINIDGKEYAFEDYLKRNNTVAFLIIQHDTIQCEQYFAGYDPSSIVASFSMAKSITSILIGCAIDDQLIRSVHDPVSDYIPELKKNGFDKITIEHLLQMTSGLKFNEGYANPFGDVANFYYGRNLRKAISKMKLENEPGQVFDYKSGNSQLLGLVLERALKDKTITQYLQEKLWIPLGMEYDASWSIDKKRNGLEKTFCCLNARARDFAKIGRLYLNKGNWNGKQIISAEWVKRSVQVDTANGSAWFYQYQWWLPTKTGDFMAQGILGQYIYVNPSKDMIIVRLGKSEGKTDWQNTLVSLANSY